MSDKDVLEMQVLAKEFPHLRELAKALWSTRAPEKRWIPEQEITRYDTGTTYTRPGYFQTVGTQNRSWQYHLQQMVIADDPVAYLRDHLLLDRSPAAKPEK